MAEDKKAEEKKKDEKKKAPELGPDAPTGEGDGDWVFYLQQMLNYKYQMQVVEENGQWDSATSNAVQHFNEYYGLGNEAKVTEKTWKELGHQESSSSSSGSGSGTTADGHVEEVEKDVNLIEANNSDQSWAAALATMLSFKHSYTVEKVCEEAGRTDKVSFSELENLARDKFHLVSLDLQAKSGATWSTHLKSNGPLLSKTSGDHHQVVVCCIKPKDDKAEVHVIDPVSQQKQWMELEDGFLKQYGLNPEDTITVYGVS